MCGKWLISEALVRATEPSMEMVRGGSVKEAEQKDEYILVKEYSR